MKPRFIHVVYLFAVIVGIWIVNQPDIRLLCPVCDTPLTYGPVFDPHPSLTLGSDMTNVRCFRDRWTCPDHPPVDAPERRLPMNAHERRIASEGVWDVD